MKACLEVFAWILFVVAGTLLVCIATEVMSCDQVERDPSPYRKVSTEKIPYGVSVITVDGKEYICARSGGGLAICPKAEQ